MSKFALNLAEDGRILSATYPQFFPADAVIVDDLPEGDISDYIYADGAYIYDPKPTPDTFEPAEPVTWAALAAAYKEGVDEA